MLISKLESLPASIICRLISMHTSDVQQPYIKASQGLNQSSRARQRNKPCHRVFFFFGLPTLVLVSFSDHTLLNDTTAMSPYLQ